MEAYRGGNRQAFERLYAHLAPRIHGFFRRSFGSESVADDLLQMTFLKVHKARTDYLSGQPLRRWIFTIAARVRLDEFRRRKRLPESGDEEAWARAEEAQVKVQIEEAGAETAERVDEVRAAVERLPESQRVIVHLHRYEGMTFGEIAEVLGTTEGALRLRAFRAYERLRQDLHHLLATESP